MSALIPVSFEHEGTALEGLAAIPQGAGPFPAVLVMHSALGLRHMVQDVAAKLAGMGYLAVATDMYGKGADLSSPMKAGAYYADLLQNPDILRARTARWFDAVAAMPQVDSDRIAAIGYCFGGKCVLELARSGADVKAIVSFHGILSTHAPARPGDIKGEVVAYCAAHDPFAPHEQTEGLRQEMIAAEAHYQITIFGDAQHGFTDPKGEGDMPGIAYNAMADRMSWAGTEALLEMVFARLST